MPVNTIEAIEAMEVCSDAQLTLCIAGSSGIGKTSIAEQFATERRAQGDFFFGVFNGATANLADTIGFLLPHAVEYTNSDGQTVTVQHGQYTYPHYFMDRLTGRPAFMFERGLMVIEEYGQATGDVKRGLATLVYEKRVGDVQLPKGFQIVLLTNRAQDRSGVTKDFDFVINRRVDIELSAELDPWMVWASENDVEPLVMAFAARNIDMVFNNKHPEKQGPWCTPRSLVAAGEVLKACRAKNINYDDENALLLHMLRGCIGGTAVQLFAFAKLRHALPSIADIIRSPLGTEVPGTPDAQMIITHELAHRTDRNTIKPFVTYMRQLPQSFAVTFLQVLLKKQPLMIGTQEVGDWARDNHDLLAVIARK